MITWFVKVGWCLRSVNKQSWLNMIKPSGSSWNGKGLQRDPAEGGGRSPGVEPAWVGGQRRDTRSLVQCACDVPCALCTLALYWRSYAFSPCHVCAGMSFWWVICGQNYNKNIKLYFCWMTFNQLIAENSFRLSMIKALRFHSSPK